MNPGRDEMVRIRSTDDDYARAVDFLYDEAALLDDRRHDEWLALLTEDVRYLVPVRITTAFSLEDSISEMAHFDEDRYSLTKRVERLHTEHAWAEDPPSRTRRFVTNVRCWRGDAAGEMLVRSNLMMFRSRGDLHSPDLLSGVREDVLRDLEGSLRLAKREIWLDEAVLRTQNLAIFL